MSSDVNVYEEIVKLNMRISCLESLLQAVIELNPRMNIPSPDEMDNIYADAIQGVIDEVDMEVAWEERREIRW